VAGVATGAPAGAAAAAIFFSCPGAFARPAPPPLPTEVVDVAVLGWREALTGRRAIGAGDDTMGVATGAGAGVGVATGAGAGAGAVGCGAGAGLGSVRCVTGCDARWRMRIVTPGTTLSVGATVPCSTGDEPLASAATTSGAAASAPPWAVLSRPVSTGARGSTCVPVFNRSASNGQPLKGSTEWFNATSPAKIVSSAPKIPSAARTTGARR